MNENIELLKLIYENAEMGKYTTEDLLNLLKNKENKIKPLLQTEIHEYEKHMNKCKMFLDKYDEEAESSGIMAKIGSKVGISMETMKDNSDSALAQMIVEGLTMGSTTLNSKLKQYKNAASKEVLSVGKDYLKYLEIEIERLKEYM